MALEAIPDSMLKNKTIWYFKGEVDYVDEWLFMSTPVTLSLITLGYLLFVMKYGPQFIKAKTVIELRNTLILYNVFQVGISCYMSYVGTKLLWAHGLVQSYCVMENKDNAYDIISYNHIYLLAKMVELMDTIFFVLKKNFRQITFLHVYHHAAMMWLTWLTLKYDPTYDVVFIGCINSWVHVIMYTYYCLSAFPEASQYLWWKKYITKIQIVQFLLVMLHGILTYCFSGCSPSYVLFALIIFNGLLFTALFSKFYYDTYKKPKTIKLTE